MRTFIILFSLGILSYSCSDPLTRLEEGTYYSYDAEDTNRYPLEFEMKNFNDTLFFDRKDESEGKWNRGYESGKWREVRTTTLKIPLNSSNNKIITDFTLSGYMRTSPDEYSSSNSSWTDFFEVKGGEVLILSDRGDLEEFLSTKVYDEYPSSK